MRPHQFQVGFLKLLKGTELYDRREEYGLVCSEDAPYEVLKTKWLSYEELDLLHRISDRVEEFVNTQGFRRSLPLAERLFPTHLPCMRRWQNTTGSMGTNSSAPPSPEDMRSSRNS